MNSIKMGVNFIYVAVLGLVLCVTFAHSEPKAKHIVCSGPAYTEKCRNLEQQQNDETKCDTNSNKFDCLVNNSTVTFARVTYEEALNSNFSNNIYVVASVHPNGKLQHVETEIVVVVKDPNIKSFKDLRNSNVCYPGFKDSNQLRYFTNDFENAILNSIEPDLCLIPNYPYVARHIKGLSDLFNFSCRPGPWVNHEEIDNALKSTYQKLCMLCNATKNYGCSSSDVNDPFEYSLDCFKNNGNVAILSKDLAMTLKSPLYLTGNGTVSSEPYVWFKKPWPLLLSNSEHPSNIPKLSNDNETITVFEKPKSLRSFFMESVNKSPFKLKCPPKLNWCTSSNYETEECELLREVVSQQRIPLDLECVEQIDKFACISSISQNETDILALQNTYGFIARSKLLESIAYSSVNISDASKSMVVVLSEDKSIKTFNDLKEKFGCFSQFGDIAFSSFVFELKKQNLIQKSCTLDNLLISFVGVSCIPGIIDPNWETLPNNLDISKFCKCVGGPTSKTDVQCSASYENEYYGNEGALKCLNEIGKYAVVTNYEIESHLNDTKYSILCKNNVKKHFNAIKDDDEDCFLSVTINQEIMTRKHDGLHIDTLAMLADMEGLPKEYSIFNKLNNLMFKNSVPILHFNNDNDTFVDNYKKVFLDYDKCMDEKHTTNFAMNTNQHLYILILPMILNLF